MELGPRPQRPPSTSENGERFLPEVVQEVVYIEPQPVAIIEKLKSLGPDAIYVLGDLLNSEGVSDKVRADVARYVLNALEAEQDKELVVKTEQQEDLDELEQIYREAGFDV